MPAKIRLQRHGKKGQPFYHIVVADGRAPRDGKYIEKIGTYNPLTKPASIVLNFDSALQWLQNGAQPTDTARSILSYKGVMYKYHLLKGVKKGALTEIEAEAKFNKWMSEKTAKIEQAAKDANLKVKEEAKKALDAEKEVNEKRAAEISKRKQEEMAALEAAAVAAAKEAAEKAAELEGKTTEEAPEVEEAAEEAAPEAPAAE